MQYKLNKSDSKRVARFEKFVKNINPLLKWKTVWEINEIFDEEDKILSNLSIDDLKKSFLENSKELRNIAISMTNKFDSIIDRLINSEKLLEWKKLDEISQFFEDIDTDISQIPDQRMRHLLIQKSEYFRESNLDKILIYSSRKTLDEIKENRKVAWNSVEEVTIFFDKLDKNISKINNVNIRAWISSFSKILRDDAIFSIELEKGFSI